MLLEKYAGALPVWLMPTQVMVIPISEAHHAYANEISDKLKAAGIRCEADYRSEKMGYKIREAQLEKIPYMLVVGAQEMENGTVSVRSRKEADQGTLSFEAFLEKIQKEIQDKVR